MDYLSLFTVCWFWGFHYIADFILQTNYQAINKSRNDHALAQHCWVYTAVMTVITFVYFNLFTDTFWGFLQICGTVMYLFSSHFLTDRVTSRKTSRYFRKKNYHMGFVIVGLDQFIHFLTIMVPVCIFS